MTDSEAFITSLQEMHKRGFRPAGKLGLHPDGRVHHGATCELIGEESIYVGYVDMSEVFANPEKYFHSPCLPYLLASQKRLIASVEGYHGVNFSALGREIDSLTNEIDIPKALERKDFHQILKILDLLENYYTRPSIFRAEDYAKSGYPKGEDVGRVRMDLCAFLLDNFYAETIEYFINVYNEYQDKPDEVSLEFYLKAQKAGELQKLNELINQVRMEAGEDQRVFMLLAPNERLADYGGTSRNHGEVETLTPYKHHVATLFFQLMVKQNKKDATVWQAPLAYFNSWKKVNAEADKRSFKFDEALSSTEMVTLEMLLKAKSRADNWRVEIHNLPDAYASVMALRN